MKYLYIILIVTNISFANAETRNTTCSPVVSSGEGHWPIPEKAFTKINAIKKLDNLKEMLDVKATYIEDLESKKHNAFVIFEGYILKKRINEYKKNSAEKKIAINAFCKFLLNKAYVSH